MMRSQHRVENVYVPVQVPVTLTGGEKEQTVTLPGGTTWGASLSSYVEIESISKPMTNAANGIYVFHLSRYKNVLDNFRVELNGKDPGLTTALLFDTQYTTKFTLHVPPDWTRDDLHEIIWQIHRVPDTAEQGLDAQPVISLRIIDNVFAVHYMYSTAPISYAGNNMEVRNSPNFGTITGNSTYNFEINYKISRGNASPDGNLTVKINDVVQYTYTGPIGSEDVVGPYIKFGIYKSVWKAEHDNPVDTISRRYGFSSMIVTTP